MFVLIQRLFFNLKNLFGLTSPLEKLIQLPIIKPKLFEQSFTHGGVPQDSYDRLEFLGDAILQTIVSNYLYLNFPDFPEGELTQMRSRLVRREALNLLGYKIGLGKYIQSDFLDFDSITSENRRIFGDTLESLIGAVYLNSGFKGAEYFVSNQLIKPFVKLDYLINEKSNYKGFLQQIAQKRNFEIVYKTLQKNNDRVLVGLLINGQQVLQVQAKTKKKAEQILAKRFVLNSYDSIEDLLFLEDE